MHVPVTAVNKDHFPARRKNEIRATWQIASMQAVPISEGVNQTSNAHLGLRVLRPNPLHVPSPLICREDIDHAQILPPGGWHKHRLESSEFALRQGILRTDMPETDSFRFIDLFAGIGGFRLALEPLGGRCVFSCDWDRFARQTYRANFGEEPAGDIRDVDERKIPAHDILTAGFPCQPFSISGVSKKNSLGRPHGFADRTQGTLFFDVVRIINQHRPWAFILENVRNLRSHDGGRTFEVILQTLERDLGYHVDHRILDARTLVPQHRERVFIVGFREPREMLWPTLNEVAKVPRLRDILQTAVDSKYTLSDKLWQYLQSYARKHQEAGNGFGFGLASLDGVTRTLSARYYKDGSEILIPQRGKNPRRLTPRECARLMGYRDTFRIEVSDTQAYRQFGNSVVVPVVEKVATGVLRALAAPRLGDFAPASDRPLERIAAAG
jgi:DNA (cytosine-5)-methyltransferase 1